MPDETKPPPLQYQIAPSPVTRGQFRLLLFLLLIQVVVSVQSAYAPGFVGWVKQRWAEHEQAAAHRAQVRQNFAAMRQCLAHMEPAGKVVWDEDPDRAAALLGGTGYEPITAYATNLPGVVANAIPRIAAAADVRAISVPNLGDLSRQASSNHALAFLHGRRVPGGPERLVVVSIGAMVQATPDQGAMDPDGPTTVHVYKAQSFVAQSFGFSPDGEAVGDGAPRCDLAIEDSSSGVAMPAHWSPPASPGEPGTLRVDYRDQLRVFAGQPDPADASHFTIPYDLDGRPGILDGWLKPDGSVQLEPRAGKRVNVIWYPHAK